MNQLEIQLMDDQVYSPSGDKLQQWLDCALSEYDQETEVVIRIVGEQEISTLNERYRHKTGPTNILSFPFEIPEEMQLNLLGDMVICAAVVNKEAREQQKAVDSHWAHIVIHGTLHLLGYDHIEAEDAKIMETEEINILEKLKIKNPYLEIDE